MIMTATLIGIGIYLIFRDLPDEAKITAKKHSWLPQIAIFILLVTLFGSSANGIAIAGIAALIFRCLMPIGTPKEKPKNKRTWRERIGEMLI